MPIQFKVDGQSHYKTIYGACMTVLFVLIVLWFVSHTVLAVYQHKDQLRMHRKTLQEGDNNGFQRNLTFYAGSPSKEPPAQIQDGKVLQDGPQSQVFNVAFGISDYHSDGSNIEDGSYGNLQVMRTSRKEDGSLAYETV